MVERKNSKQASYFDQQYNSAAAQRLTIDPNSHSSASQDGQPTPPSQGDHPRLSVVSKQAFKNYRQGTKTTAVPPHQTLSKSVIQIDTSYFDNKPHQRHAQRSGRVKESYAEVMASPEQQPENQRIQPHVLSMSDSRGVGGYYRAPGNLTKRFSSPPRRELFEKPQPEENYGQLTADRLHSGYPRGNDHQVSPVAPTDESPNVQRHKVFNSDINKPAVGVMTHLRRSFQEVQPSNETNSHIQDHNSARNLISFNQRSNSRAPTANSSLLMNNQGLAVDGDGLMVTPTGSFAGESQGQPQIAVYTPDKPIVPKQDYIPKVDSHQEQILAAATAKTQAQESPADAPAQSIGWLQSLSLSVSQLFTGSSAQAADGNEENAAVKQEQKRRRLSSNGEVPIDEEEEGCDAELSPSKDELNIDVVQEQIRVHQGNSVRKKIKFEDQRVASKASGARGGRRVGGTSLKASLISAQSYNQIDSGSDDQGESGSSAWNRKQEKENVLSYTTSQQEGNSSPQKYQQHNQMAPGSYNSNQRQQRQHSSSAHENFGASFSNLAFSLLPSRQQQRDPAMLSPQPKRAKEGEASASGQEESKIGAVFSQFLARVTNTNQKESKQMKEEEDLMSSAMEDKQPPFQRARSNLFKNETPNESEKVNGMKFGRMPSKTMHHERRPLLSNSKPEEASRPEEKLRQIDNIVFNQDKSHFAVIWTDGGFTKYDVVTLKIVQRVRKTPSFYQHDSKPGQDDMTDEITLVNTESIRQRHLGKRQISNIVQKKQAPKGDSEVEDDEQESSSDCDDDLESDCEQFKCVALQHRTRDYIATLVRNPQMAIFVHIKEDPQSQQPRKKKHKKKQSLDLKLLLGTRTDVKHFKEEVQQIEILPGARYTMICLWSAIYLYTKNSSDLYDIVQCSSPALSSAIVRTFEQKLVLAYLSSDDDETVLVHDFSVSQITGKDTVYEIAKPFGAGYKVGGVQLDELGQRIVIVSSDGCYVYLYALEEEQAKQGAELGQDQLAPEEGKDEAEAASSMINQADQNRVVIKAPQQSFKRSSSSCQKIYLPIQIVEGFSMQEHVCDFILLSSSSMTAHLFALKNHDELEEYQTQQKESSWTISRFLPSSLTLERSKIRLNITEELAPVAYPSRGAAEGSRVSAPSQVEVQGQNEYKKYRKEHPYTCFVESSGLLVMISHSGFCCKYSIDLQNELSKLDARYSGFNSVRGSRPSPTNQGNMMLFSQVSLGQSLAQLKDMGPSARQRSQVQHGRQRLASKSPSKPSTIESKLRLETASELGTSELLEAVDGQPAKPNHRLGLSSVTNSSAQQLKRATAFSGYKQPALRMQHKIDDFFISIDQKALSLRRIKKRQILEHRTNKMKQRAQMLSQMHRKRISYDFQQPADDPNDSQLKRLLRGSSPLKRQR